MMLPMLLVFAFSIFSNKFEILKFNINPSSLATSVGAKTLNLKQTVFIAAICEFSGAFFVGAQVSGSNFICFFF